MNSSLMLNVRAYQHRLHFCKTYFNCYNRKLKGYLNIFGNSINKKNVPTKPHDQADEASPESPIYVR